MLVRDLDTHLTRHDLVLMWKEPSGGNVRLGTDSPIEHAKMWEKGVDRGWGINCEEWGVEPQLRSGRWSEPAYSALQPGGAEGGNGQEIESLK